MDNIVEGSETMNIQKFTQKSIEQSMTARSLHMIMAIRR